MSNLDLAPPPAPPLPPGRISQLQRIIAPWGRHIGPKSHGSPSQGEGNGNLDRITGRHTYSSQFSRTATHRTSIPIAALDINKQKTHAILAGREILKTVRIHDGKVTEDFNLRASITSYASAHTSPHSDAAEKRRDYLPARDVKWSIGHWEHIVAAAATNGRISLYDLNAPSAKTEWAWLHEHTGQVNKLDIDPHAGYLLLSAGQDKSVKLWDLRVPKPEKSLTRFEVRSAVRDVRWSPTEVFDFAVCADSGVVQKWDVRSPMLPKLSINAHEKACYSVDYHPDGRHVISGGFDKYIRVWDFETERKRQKPILQLKTPHAVKNIRWRPACSISESDESGVWQSTQVAVSYHHDDPRIHVWDLRRPLLPFRELDRYHTPANDLLWAEKDLLWTVGDDGVFTQWDLRRTLPFSTHLAPCASRFVPDSRYFTFLEDRELRHESFHDDPSIGFLSVPRDKLSSGDEGFASRSLTDDEGGLETTVGTSFRRREGFAASSKSNKSQTNSPPSVDDKPSILSLDQAVLTRPDVFDNDQSGAASYIPGVAVEPDVAKYLASHYAAPATVEEIRSCPAAILRRLEGVFVQNAAACDMVAMHRMAQTWRVLGAVIVPELKDWADSNRARRRADAARRRETLESFKRSGQRPGLSPLAGLPTRGQESKYDSKGHKLISSLFKAVPDGNRARNIFDGNSTSNMTTPLVKPLPNSPPIDDKRWAHVNIEDALDNLPPLPPSVLTSHSTAAAAARALMESPERVIRSDTPSPVVRRSDETTDKLSTVTQSPLSPVKRPKSDSLVEQKQLPTQNKSQEDRRAALRDYRVQARPILNLADSLHQEAPRNDSEESFHMFSVSTDSSNPLQSLARSLDSPRDAGRAAFRRLPSDLSSQNDEVEESDSDLLGGRSNPQQDPRNAPIEQRRDVAASRIPPDMSVEPGPGERISLRKDQDIYQEHASHLGTAVSSSPDIFHFEAVALAPKPRIHTSNPIRFEADMRQNEESNPISGSGVPTQLSLNELDNETYLYQDFCPIDLSKYEPKLPFAWSSLPLICQCLCFDLENGIAHAQFAAHLLMHVHPYFFGPSFRELKLHGQCRSLDNLADRLMTPRLGHRIIGSILETHLTFLNQMALFEPAALLRKICVEFEHPQVYRSGSEGKQAGSSLSSGDRSTLSIACSNCQGPMSAGRSTCERCRKSRTVCPICQSLEHGYIKSQDPGTQIWGRKNNMWMACQACGHGGHVPCLMDWFNQAFSEGACPTSGCGCDCGPGLTRETRLQQQIKRDDEAKLIRGTSPAQGTSGSTKRDSLKAAHSPAVDKARVALRNSFAVERSTQSGDERSLPGDRGSSRGRTSGLSGSRKSVRWGK